MSVRSGAAIIERRLLHLCACPPAVRPWESTVTFSPPSPSPTMASGIDLTSYRYAMVERYCDGEQLIPTEDSSSLPERPFTVAALVIVVYEHRMFVRVSSRSLH